MMKLMGGLKNFVFYDKTPSVVCRAFKMTTLSLREIVFNLIFIASPTYQAKRDKY